MDGKEKGERRNIYIYIKRYRRCVLLSGLRTCFSTQRERERIDTTDTTNSVYKQRRREEQPYILYSFSLSFAFSSISLTPSAQRPAESRHNQKEIPEKRGKEREKNNNMKGRSNGTDKTDVFSSPFFYHRKNISSSSMEFEPLILPIKNQERRAHKEVDSE